MVNDLFEGGESAVVHVGGGEDDIAERGGGEFVAVGAFSGGVLEA